MNSIINYLEKEFELSAIDKAKLKYSFDVLFTDISKVFILFLIFSFLGYFKEYAYSILVLLTLRPFTGGLHFKTYTACLIFTGFFLITSIVLSNIILLDLLAPFFFVFSFIIMLSIAPIISKNRPSYSYDKRLRFKILGLVIVSAHYIIFMISGKSTYFSISIWIILLQSIQLLIKKGVDVYEKYKKYDKTFS